MDPESPDLELVVGGRPVRFPAVWLRDNCGDGRTEDDKELWLPGDLAGLPAMSWPSYLAGGKAEALEAVLRLGFVLLSGVPGEPGRVLEVAASFGYVRETNYGRLFDVRVEPIKKLNYGRACRSSSSARPAGSAGSASTTGRCGRCGGRT